MLNRGAVIVGPRKPYIDWAANLDDSGLTPESDGERTVYLIPNFDTDIDALETLSQCYEFIFEEELNAWHTDDSQWPKNRTFKLFREWFEFEFCSMIDDICDYELVDDDNF